MSTSEKTTERAIEEMAREAGMQCDGGRWYSDSGDPLDAQDVELAHLARFAALVRAKALDEAAAVGDSLCASLDLDASASLAYERGLEDMSNAILALKTRHAGTEKEQTR